MRNSGQPGDQAQGLNGLMHGPSNL
jgi:hypothetical protein